MSGQPIKDGSGSGWLAKVDENRRVWTDSVIQPEEVSHAASGQTFAASTGLMTFASTSEHVVFWLRNNSSSHNMCMALFSWNWDGGASYNAPLQIVLYKLSSSNTPSANYTEMTLGNLNWTSGNTADATGYKWDGVGTGMTLPSAGIPIFTNIFMPGYTGIKPDGIPILGNGGTLAMSFTPYVTGKGIFSMRIFFKEV
jgi:hypothetical protein